MPDLLIPDFRRKLKTAYENALSNGEVVHIPTELINVDEGGVAFEVRHAKSLQAKPAPTNGAQREKKKDKKGTFVPDGLLDMSLNLE